ncbi:lipase secretion chaperone [Photobacterium sp. TY1-4]|uniref:lipase secretion chaperone n=1 Tax=Photobacterium sp. TY1-4 TaxID=2899122 RepID=UPI0021C1B3F7|nr:lipase secretion chaperone [Photobacterium sp. TY1-4]UXI03928.1 lipase chaperone [Photobacterium sp. TY1-4]
MKKTVLAVLGVVVTVGAVTDNQFSDESPILAASQLDTQVDRESSRDTFEYFLSGLGEVNLPAISDHLESYNQAQATSHQLDESLFQQFVDYKAALQTLNLPDVDTLAPEALQVLHEQLLILQQQFFSAEQQTQLFSEENQLRQLALTQLALKRQATSDADYQTLWQQELSRLSPDLRKSYHNATLLSQLQQTYTLTSQERYLQQQALVGPEAAERLTQLTQKRQHFQETLQQYLARRDTILADPGFTAQEQASEIRQLREASFPAHQQRRVSALESMQHQPQHQLN